MSEKKTKCRAGMALEKRFLGFDRYSYPVALNVSGKTSIPSYPGTFTTIILLAVLAAYAGIKMEMLIYFENPLINQATMRDHFQKEKRVNLTDIGFQIAWSVMDYKLGFPLDDPEYVKWTVQLNRYVNQNSVEKIPLKFHKCTDENFNSFYPPAKSHSEAILAARNSGSMYCLDPGQDIIIFGSNNFWYQRFEVMLQPCKPDFVKNVCINRTLEESNEYLRSFGKGTIPDLYIMENVQRFDFTEFKDIKVIKESVVNSIHLNQLQASTEQAIVQLQQVQDQVSALNLGAGNTYDLFEVHYEPLRPSSSNQFPNNYKFVGVEYIFTTDYRVYNRQSYDLLNWFGDVGGLDAALSLIGFIIVYGYSEFNAYSFLITRLFVQSNNAFQGLRSLMKSSKNQFDSIQESARDVNTTLKMQITRMDTSNMIFGSERNEFPPDSQSRVNEAKLGKHIFKNFNRNQQMTTMKQDFDSRTHIQLPNVFQTLIGMLCRTKSYRRFMRMQRIGKEKADHKLDIVRILKQSQVSAVELWALMRKHQHQISHKLAEFVLSEFSSSESSDSQDKRKKQFPGIYLYDIGENQNESFIQNVLSEEVPINIRLLRMYNALDVHRNQKWQKQNPEQAMKQNLHQLKILIARNLIKNSAQRQLNRVTDMATAELNLNDQTQTQRIEFLDEYMAGQKEYQFNSQQASKPPVLSQELRVPQNMSVTPSIDWDDELGEDDLSQ